MACRDVDQGQAIKDGLLGELPLAKLTVVKLDLANLESIRTFAQRIQAAELTPDLLINNAGIYRVPKRQETEDGFELQFGVNHLGHFALTGLLLPGNAAAARFTRRDSDQYSAPTEPGHSVR